MEETIGCKTVQQLETFLQEEYHAQPVEPVDYLLYNARQQMLNLFYPQQMQQLAEQIGFGPESDEEICALFDCLTETFDRETAGSRYVQYCFTQTLPEGVQAVFYVTVERVTGFVLPQFEWASEGNGEGVGESFPRRIPRGVRGELPPAQSDHAKHRFVSGCVGAGYSAKYPALPAV